MLGLGDVSICGGPVASTQHGVGDGCAQFAVSGLCEREGECFYPHVPGERFECNLVVMVNMNAMERVANRLEQLLRGPVVTGACRATHTKSSVMALFVQAPMGVNEAVHLIAFDRFLEPALVRVLLVDSQRPPLNSLDEVVSDAVSPNPISHTNAMCISSAGMHVHVVVSFDTPLVRVCVLIPHESHRR
jgi:hypothetical protein